MKKLWMLFVLVSLSFATAHETYHGSDSFRDSYYYNSVGHDDYNEKRYPTYDYRHGYTYRESKEYYYDKVWRSADREGHKRDLFRNPSYYDYDFGADYYYKYDGYRDSYSKVKCYDYPPRGKVFYRKCP